MILQRLAFPKVVYLKNAHQDMFYHLCSFLWFLSQPLQELSHETELQTALLQVWSSIKCLVNCSVMWFCPGLTATKWS